MASNRKRKQKRVPVQIRITVESEAHAAVAPFVELDNAQNGRRDNTRAFTERAIRNYFRDPYIEKYKPILRLSTQIQRLMYTNIHKIAFTSDIFNSFLKQFFGYHPRLVNRESIYLNRKRGENMYASCLNSFEHILKMGGAQKEVREQFRELFGPLEERFNAYVKREAEAREEYEQERRQAWEEMGYSTEDEPVRNGGRKAERVAINVRIRVGSEAHTAVKPFVELDKTRGGVARDSVRKFSDRAMRNFVHDSYVEHHRMILRAAIRVQRLVYINIDNVTFFVEAFTVFLKRFFGAHARLENPATQQKDFEHGDRMYESYIDSFLNALKVGGSTKELREHFYDQYATVEDQYMESLRQRVEALAARKQSPEGTNGEEGTAV